MVELSDDPREREIFLRALRYYSDSCEPPELIAECPFSVDQGPGQRGCGEECLDILATYNAPSATEEIIDDGISVVRIVRPRARRSRLSNKPYDAREVYLTDKAKPPQWWSLASVLQGLIEEISTEPPSESDLIIERQERLHELVRIVGERGLDFAVHILPCLRNIIIVPVLAKLLKNQAIANNLSYIRIHTISWANSVSFDELIDWKISIPIDSMETHQGLPTPDAIGQWIFDRFTRTYLDDWTTESLRKEWDYIHGQETTPCPSNEMLIRVVSEEELSKVMADRLARSEQRVSALADSFIMRAIEFLKKRRRDDAVLLFKAATLKEPKSAKAYNNLGFCLLPDNPNLALQHFEKALTLVDGIDKRLVNTNRILTLAILGRPASAIDLGNSVLSADKMSGQFIYWLWDYNSLINDNIAQLIRCTDLGEYVRGLVEKISNKSFPPGK